MAIAVSATGFKKLMSSSFIVFSRVFRTTFEPSILCAIAPDPGSLLDSFRLISIVGMEAMKEW